MKTPPLSFHLITGILILVATLFAPTTLPAQNVTWTPSGPSFSEAQKQVHRDAARALLANLESALAGGANVFQVPPGDYLFDVPGAPGFHLRNRHGLTIRAEGATFWFGPNQGVLFEDCSGIRLSGLTIDSDRLPWTQGVIEELDPVARTLVFRVSPGYKVFEKPALPENWRILVFDPQTRIEVPVYDDWATAWEPTVDGRIRITRLNSARMFRAPVPDRPVRVGDLVAFFPIAGGGANVHMVNCESLTFENITIHAAEGFAFHERYGNGGNRYLGCRIIRRPQTDRLMAGRGDGFHSYLMRRGPLIEGCQFSHTGDDLLNIHSFFGVVLDVLSPSEINIAKPFGRSFDLGTTLDFMRSDGHGGTRQAVILGMEEITDPAIVARATALPETLMRMNNIRTRNFPRPAVFRVHLDRPGAAELHDFVSSPSHAGAGTVIRNSHFHDGHVRGLLLKTEDALVERNRIERTGHAGIALKPCGFFIEGSFPRRIRILDNHLSETGRATFTQHSGKWGAQAAIHVGPQFGTRLFPWTLSGGITSREIRIRGNTIDRPHSFGIFVTNTANITIANNTITSPFAGGPRHVSYNFSAMPDPRLPLTLGDRNILSDVRFAIMLIETRNVSRAGNIFNNPPPFMRGNVGSVAGQ